MKPKDEKYTIAVDFDGVIHRYDSPWVSADVIPDGPVEGAIDWLNKMRKDFTVVIFTTRGSDESGQNAVRDWLKINGVIDADSIKVTDHKVAALVYIDDRAWRFAGWFPNAQDIHEARPWNKVK